MTDMTYRAQSSGSSSGTKCVYDIDGGLEQIGWPIKMFNVNEQPMSASPIARFEETLVEATKFGDDIKEESGATFHIWISLPLWYGQHCLD